jgi:hypothetical protein
MGWVSVMYNNWLISDAVSMADCILLDGRTISE